MLEIGMPISKISQITGLKEFEIKAIDKMN